MMSKNIAVFSGSHCTDLSNRICQYISRRYTAINLGIANCAPHPNGETMIRIEDDVRDRDVFVVSSLCHRYSRTKENPYSGVNDNLMELLVYGDTLSRSSANRRTAVVPFFGYARQDRKSQGRTPITARLIADLIVSAGYNRVLTMDLHAEQIQGFFPGTVPLDHLTAGKVITDALSRLDLSNAVVLSPDVGNLKKADKYRIGLPKTVGLALIDKRRDTDGRVRSQRLIGDVKDKTVVLLDDMISTAGTMRSAIDIAIEQGAKEFYLAATHGEFVGSAVEKLKIPQIKRIFVTDTIPLMPHVSQALPVTVLSTDELFGEAILRIHEGKSISKLLGEFGS